MSSEGRLPGDPGSTERDLSDVRAETRLSGDLAARFEHAAEHRGVSEAELLRNALDEFLPELENNDYVLPQNPDLRSAYQALALEGEKRTLSVDAAKDILADTSHDQTKKAVLRERVLEPLDERGFINVVYGTVAVHPLTRRDEVLQA